MSKEKYTLYIKGTCPYCKKVLNFLKEKGVSIDVKDISHEKHKNFLMEHGGKTQVPCLFIENKPLYESDDIISLLDENL